MNKIFKQIDYDKISDDLAILGPNVVMRFNVTMSKALADGTRSHYHKEYEYKTNKYTDVDTLLTIRRSFDYYLTIENFRNNEFGVKEFIMIRIQDILYVREQVNEATKWFRDAKYSNLFARKDNKVVIVDRVEPIYISGLVNDKYMILEPTVINYGNDVSSPGIRLYLASKSNYVDMTIDKFMGIVYILQSINMYQSAQILLNYLQRPDFGTNVYAYGNSNAKLSENDEDKEQVEIKSNNRQIGNNVRKKSFFDKMDDL